jgi:pimeloyl-ACP methyl ester carboxylesterase
VSATPLWFGPEDRPLFGWVHLPEGGQVRGAVVLCPPLGYEQLCAHRTFRVLAEHLAERGMVALRFDYDGTGDSFGTDDDPDRVNAWVRSAGDAVDLLRTAGAPTVALVGMRIGATIAAHAVAAGADSLVLWDPVDGRRFLRQLRALQLLGLGKIADEDGSASTAGVYSAKVAAELRELSFPDLSDSGLPVLTLLRSDKPTPKAFDELLPGDALHADAVDQDRLLDQHSSAAVVPTAAVEEITAWLTAGASRSRPLRLAPMPTRATVGDDISEESTSLGPLGLFAIITQRPARPHRPTLVLLNTGSDHHIGPGRQWVEWGREMARRGFRSVRVDLSGLGDSPVRPGQIFERPYAPEAGEDIAEVIAQVDEGQGVVLVGLCSGARNALEAARTLPVRAVCCINPVIHLPMHALQHMTNENPDPPELRALDKYGRIRHTVLTSLPGPVWRLLDQRGVYPSPLRPFEEIVGRGVDTLLVYGSNDHLLPRLQETSRAALSRLRHQPGFRFELVEGMDHAVLAQQPRQALMALLTTHLVERFGADEP